MTIAIFAYGSLVSSASASMTLGGRFVTPMPATLAGWRRGFTLARDNRRSEKTFARADDGTIPNVVLALNARPDPTAEGEVNGGLIAVSEADLTALDRRELRYERLDVTDSIATGPAGPGAERIFIYSAKAENLALEQPAGAVILAAYERAAESAFAALGDGQLEAYRASTDECPVERIEAVLVSDNIPPGNPRGW